jgi:ribosomal protein S12 methylthiotransferase accessory factor
MAVSGMAKPGDLGQTVAVSRRIGAPREEIMFGFGAHLDPATVLRRSLTELNQLMPVVLDTDGTHTGDDPDALRS